MENLIILIGLIIILIIIIFDCKCIIRQTKPKNNVHFYVARDPDGSLWLYIGKPFRKRDRFSTRIPDSWTRLSHQEVFKYFGLNKNDFNNLYISIIKKIK